MTATQEIFNEGITLSPDEEQLLTYLVWLLDAVDERERRRILSRVTDRLSHAQLDHAGLMDELGNVITEFESVEA